MGLAREAGDRQAAVAEAGRAYGTPYYIAPEQIRGEANIDFRVDIYSLGATFYHMVTGRVPFDGPTPAAVMHKHLREPLTPPDHINPKLSSGLAEVIEVMMAKDRDHRYPSTTDLIKDLDSVSRGQAPVLARQRYDAAVLERLADGTVSEDGLPDEAGAVGGGGRGLLIWLSVGLGASLLLNLILLAWLAAQ
jgi:serine/threonine protein kinase